jgi:hypothetical protein
VGKSNLAKWLVFFLFSTHGSLTVTLDPQRLSKVGITSCAVFTSYHSTGLLRRSDLLRPVHLKTNINCGKANQQNTPILAELFMTILPSTGSSFLKTKLISVDLPRKFRNENFTRQTSDLLTCTIFAKNTNNRPNLEFKIDVLEKISETINHEKEICGTILVLDL